MLFALLYALSICAICVNSGTVSVHLYGRRVEQHDSQATDVYWYNQYYTMQLGIGNPPQALNLTFHFGPGSPYVFTDGLIQGACKDSKRNGTGTVVTDRKLLMTRLSTTYRTDGTMTRDYDEAMNTLYYNDDCFDWSTYGYKASDDIKVSNVTVKKQPFMAISRFNVTLAPYWPDSGLLYLEDRYYKLPQKIAKAVGDSQLTLVLNRTVGVPADNSQVGTLTFGGADTHNCESNWTKLPYNDMSGIGLWNLQFKSFSTGGRKWTWQDGYEPELVIYPTSTIEIYRDSFNRLANILPVVYDYKSQMYQVNCTDVDSLQDIVFYFANGYELHIPAKDYVQLPVGKPKPGELCPILATSTSADDTRWLDYYNEVWTLGLPAAKAHCWLYNYEDNSVSFAKTKESS